MGDTGPIGFISGGSYELISAGIVGQTLSSILDTSIISNTYSIVSTLNLPPPPSLLKTRYITSNNLQYNTSISTLPNNINIATTNYSTITLLNNSATTQLFWNGNYWSVFSSIGVTFT